MNAASDDFLSRFHWQPQPAAAEAVDSLLSDLLAASAWLRDFAAGLLRDTGTRLIDFTDHFAIPAGSEVASRLEQLGFRPEPLVNGHSWRHPQGLFPEIRTSTTSIKRIAIAVESVADFLAVHQLTRHTEIVGPPGGPFRRASVISEGASEIWIVERHGSPHDQKTGATDRQRAAAAEHLEAFRLRQRQFDNPSDGFAHAKELIAHANRDLGADWVCDRFFAAEREFWQRRNRAGQVQKARQDALGVGWANHDHHTYRCSRQHFAELVSVLELLGFECRERFYGGHESGWGAQVLEQPQARIVIFADVDLSPEELSGDFAHEGLAPRDRLGTVGLWCALHGEAFLQAGMHHLECRFDFDAARQQLATLGIASMRPFTDLPYLKQAFTEAEPWTVEPSNIERLLAAGRISQQQAEQFCYRGALGSHLEILQRDEGYKGFNQSGISEIIAETDPRRPRVNLVSPS